MKKMFLLAAVIVCAAAISFSSDANLAGPGISLDVGIFSLKNKDKNNDVEALKGIFNVQKNMYSEAAGVSVFNLGRSMSYERGLFNKQYIGFYMGCLGILDSAYYNVLECNSALCVHYFSDYEVFDSAYSMPIGIYYKYKLTEDFSISVSVEGNVEYSEHRERREVFTNNEYEFTMPAFNRRKNGFRQY
jgi:hypothetical protein